jgi:glycosyltransferase involved in cell wall biosynthesis
MSGGAGSTMLSEKVTGNKSVIALGSNTSTSGAALSAGPLISVVTPAYNEEKHLAECIESVLAQTYEQWDYLIVNNRSTDRTLEIAQSYAQKDPRIRIHTNDAFVPVMVNFNAAFRSISKNAGYCKVVGGDDRLYPQCLEKMVATAERYPTAAIVGSYGIYGERVEPVGPPFPQEFVSGREACRCYLTGRPYFYGTPTTLLYRADVVRRHPHFFCEDYLHADLAACFSSLENDDFAFCHEILTFNREREGSLTSTAQLYNRYILEHLSVLREFGPIYLDDAAMKKQIRWTSATLYKHLGQRLCSGLGREFWVTQRKQFATFGQEISGTRLALHAFLSLLEMAAGRLRW